MPALFTHYYSHLRLGSVRTFSSLVDYGLRGYLPAFAFPLTDTVDLQDLWAGFVALVRSVLPLWFNTLPLLILPVATHWFANTFIPLPLRVRVAAPFAHTPLPHVTLTPDSATHTRLPLYVCVTGCWLWVIPVTVPTV